MEAERGATPREGSFHIQSWEVRLEPDAVEGLLETLRKESPGLIIQAFSASRAPNAAAIEMIAAQTLTAAKSGSTLAERPEMDLLLRLAGTRQIGEAFKLAGYKTDARHLFVVAASAGGPSPLKRLRERLSRDRRFSAVPKKSLRKHDLELVERAALLAVRL